MLRDSSCATEKAQIVRPFDATSEPSKRSQEVVTYTSESWASALIWICCVTAAVAAGRVMSSEVGVCPKSKQQ